MSEGKDLTAALFEFGPFSWQHRSCPAPSRPEAFDDLTDGKRGFHTTGRLEQLPESLLRKDGVLVITQKLLVVLGLTDEPYRGFPHGFKSEFGNVPGPFGVDSQLMKFLVRGFVIPTLACFDQLFEFLGSQVNQGTLGCLTQGLSLGGLFQAPQEIQIAIAAKGVE